VQAKCKHPASKAGAKGAVHASASTVHEFVRAMAAAHKRCLAKSANAAAKQGAQGWFADSKQPVEDHFVEFKALAAASRSALASAYGNTPVKFILPVGWLSTTTVTTGLMDTPFPLAISASTEFTALAALFDEYRFRGGRLEFTVVTPTSTVVLGTSSLTANAPFTIGFDPSDATAPTAAIDLLQLQYHKQIFPRMIATPTVGTYVGVYGTQDNTPYKFHWKIPADAPLTGNGGAVGPGMWKATAGNVANFPDGTIKVIYQTGESTVKTGLIGTFYWDVEFRART